MKVKKVLSRVYTNDAEEAVRFYEELFQTKISSRFTRKNPNLEVINIDSLLIIAGTEEELATVRNTNATFSVDSLDEYKEMLLKNGATVLHDVRKVATGYNMTVRHKDGIVVEYVQRNID